jgi:putative ABC transport system ATP-binding protein
MIEATGIVKKFTQGEVETVVLRGVDLRVGPGEFVAIMGRSGAGKSTLLYQLALLDEPTEGEVEILGKKTARLSAEVKSRLRLEAMGFVFQDYALLPELTAEENVMLPLLAQGLAPVTARARAEATLARLGLGHRFGNLPSQLSGGEQQRVSIARAIVHEPKILFADEPTANLDSVAAALVIETFEKLHGEGQTIVMVTHEEEYTRRVDRVVRLDDGRVVSDEAPRRRAAAAR